MRPVLEPQTRPPRPLLLLAGALALTAAAYAQAPQGGFVWDDQPLIEKSASVQSRSSTAAALFLKPFWDRSEQTEPTSVYYRPVTTMTYWLDQRISGGDPSWFHLVNVLLHLGCVTLVFLLALRAGGSPVAAGLAAALFGIAPRLTESVAWISGRTDLLATLFALLAVALHRPGRGALARRVAAAAAIFLGLLCKEVALAAPVGLAAGALARARRDRQPLRSVAIELLPAVVAVAAYGVLRLAATAGVRDPPAEATLAARLLSAAQALGTYLAMLLDALRPRLQIGELQRPEPALIALGVALALALVALAIRAGRHAIAPEVATALAMAGTAIFLVLHLIPIRVNVIAADRFLYLPIAALAVGGAGAARAWAPAWRRRIALAALLVVPAFAVATGLRVRDWVDEERLWREAVRTTPPSNVLPALELGNVLRRAGRHQEALPLYEQAYALSTELSLRNAALGSIANTLSDLGQYDRARALMHELVALEPRVAVIHYDLGVIEARRLDFDAAERELREAVRLYPAYQDAASALSRLPGLRAEAAALPPEHPNDPTPLRARRAGSFARLGRDLDAERLYTAVAHAPDATAEEALAAAGFLVRRGRSPQAAKEALARATALGANPVAIKALDEAAGTP
jgi:protein O-mannosyl-transferase